MNMKKALMILILLASIFIACNDEKEEVAILEISSSELTTLSQPFLHIADHRTVGVTTNQDVVKVTSSESWCKAAILEDNGTHLRISVLPNTGFEERKAEVSVFAKGLPEIKIPVLQWSDQPSLSVANMDDINIVDGDLDFSIEVTSNVDYVITYPEWLNDKGDNTPIVGNKIYKFSASFINPGARDGEIKIEAEGYENLNKTIKINQRQNTLHPTVTTFSPTSAEKYSTVTLYGESFGTLADIVKVYFNNELAEIQSISNTELTVLVPRSPGEQCDISVVVGDERTTYASKFSYEKSWALHTVTGNGTATFKAGTLDKAQIKARYITIDANNNIFASHRETFTDLYFVRINEAENIVESLTGTTSLNKDVWVPNSPCVGPNGVVYVPNDVKNGTSYYSLDPQNNWTPVMHTVTYSTAPPASSYLYSFTYNEQDGYLYGIIGNSKGQIVKIDPKTNQGSITYEWGLHPYWYSLAFEPSNFKMLYTMVNSGNPGYGLWRKDISGSTAFTRLNSAGPTAAASASLVKDEGVTTAAFARCYQMVFGKDGNLYVSDEVNHVIRKIDLTKQTVETVVGISGSAGFVDGKRNIAKLNRPRGLAWNKEGTGLYISDTDNNRIRKWSFD